MPQRYADEVAVLDTLSQYLEPHGYKVGSDWRINFNQRSLGESLGDWDTYYVLPGAPRLRSRPQVLRYLQSCGSPSPEDVKDGKEVAAEARLTALAQGFPFLRLHMDLIIKILSSTPPWELLRISALCTTLAQACEPLFQEACRKHPHWQRRREAKSRGAAKAFKWRSLYWQNACRTCGGNGLMSISRPTPANCAMRHCHSFWLCKSCYKVNEVVLWLQKNRCTLPSAAL